MISKCPCSCIIDFSQNREVYWQGFLEYTYFGLTIMAICSLTCLQSPKRYAICSFSYKNSERASFDTPSTARYFWLLFMQDVFIASNFFLYDSTNLSKVCVIRGSVGSCCRDIFEIVATRSLFIFMPSSSSGAREDTKLASPTLVISLGGYLLIDLSWLIYLP